jgi:hypothetical protein
MSNLISAEQLQGLADSFKYRVRAASTVDVPLAGTLTALDTVPLADGDRVLLKNQSTASENGIYTWASGTQMLTRARDFQTGNVTSAMLISVQEGATYATSIWQLSTPDPITVGVTNLMWMMAGGGGANDLANTLTSGNTTGGTDIEVSSTDKLTAAQGDALNIETPNNAGGAGGDINLTTGDGASGDQGGDINLVAGLSAGGGANGGDINLTAGQGGDENGGGINVLAGPGGSSFFGGQTTIDGGTGGPTDGFGGNILLRGGAAGGTNGGGGSATLAGRDGNGSGDGGDLNLDSGSGGSTGGGGDILITSGTGNGGGNAGRITLQGGQGVGGGTAGAVDIKGGLVGLGGSINIEGGPGATVNIDTKNAGGSGSVGDINIRGGDCANAVQAAGDINILGGDHTNGAISGDVNLTGGSGGALAGDVALTGGVPDGGVAATGSITTIAVASLVDGEDFTIDDGVNPAVTFEFDDDASVTETDTLRQVDISAITTADQVRDAIVTAITNTPLFDVTASNGGAATVSLVNDRSGTAGNVSITENVTNAGFIVAGMSGGTNFASGGDILSTPNGLGEVTSAGPHRLQDGLNFDEQTLRPLAEANAVKAFASDGTGGLDVNGLYAIDENGNVNRLMLPDQHFINVAAKSEVDGSSGTLAAGQFYFDPSNYEPGRSFFFGGVLSVDVTTSTGSLILYNLTDAEVVTTSGLTLTGGGSDTPQKVESSLTLGTAAGNLQTTEKIYEVRIENNGTTEVTLLGNAFMRVK